MQAELEALFLALGTVSPPKVAVAVTPALRAAVRSTARGDGLWDVFLHVDPNTPEAAEDGNDELSVELRGSTRSLVGRLELSGRFVFEQVPSGDYRLAVGVSVERLRALVSRVSESMARKRPALSHVLLLTPASGGMQVASVLGGGTLVDGLAGEDVVWKVRRSRERASVEITTKDRLLLGQKLTIRAGDVTRTAKFIDLEDCVQALAIDLPLHHDIEVESA